MKGNSCSHAVWWYSFPHQQTVSFKNLQSVNPPHVRLAADAVLKVSTTEDESGYSVEEAPPLSIENAPSPEPISMPEEEVDDWFGEGREPFSPAERGSFDRIAREDGFRNWSLLICWPSNGQWPAGCLQEFAGNDFFYVGEGEGGATRMPWRVLREEWELVRRVEIPTWPGFQDALWWYRRKEPGALSRDR